MKKQVYWVLILAVSVTGGAAALDKPVIDSVDKQFKMEGDELTLQLRSNEKPAENHTWRIGPNRLNASIDKSSGLLRVNSGATLEFDVNSSATIDRLRIYCDNGTGANKKTGVRDVYVEVAMDLAKPRYNALRPGWEDNIRNLSLNVFMLGRPDGNGDVAPNSIIYNSTLHQLAQILYARAGEAALADTTYGRLLENGDHAGDMQDVLGGIIAEFRNYPNHPLQGVPLWQFYTSDQFTGSQQDRRTAVFCLLHELGELGIEIPFIGCIDRTMARWLFNQGINPDSDFLGSTGIGDLVEHHYYTRNKEQLPTSAWYVGIGKTAGVLKYIPVGHGGTPDYSAYPIPNDLGVTPPVNDPNRRYDCPAIRCDHHEDASSHDSSKDNGYCCDDSIPDCVNVGGNVFCSMFEGACSMSSDPCQ